MAKRLCEAPDHTANPHAAYLRFGYHVVVAPRMAYWYFACEDELKRVRNEIAMGKTQLVIKRWWGGSRGKAA